MTALEAMFWTAAAAVMYAYAGYPALLALAAWLRPAPAVRKAEITPTVSVLLVVHDEEHHVEARLRNLLSLDYPAELLEILVISDGSRDRTEEVARRFASDRVRLLSLPGPRGKPSALEAAVPLSRGEILVFADARQRFAPDALRRLAANFADPSVGAVSGELHLAAPIGPTPSEAVGAYWTYEKLLRRLESRLDSTVGATGAIYALRRSLFVPLDPRTILDDVALPMRVVLAGHRVVFEPLARADDQIPEDPAREYRRKVRTLAGNCQLAWLYPALLDPLRNRLFWQFLSHKVSRLLVPWCLLALLVTSALLAREGLGFFRAAFLIQAAFYLLAAAGGVLGRLRLQARLLSVPYTFALLNLAAAFGLIRWLRGAERASWRGTSP